MSKFIRQEMRVSEAASYKQIQRPFETGGSREILLQLFRNDAPFVIGDPTEMLRL